MTKFSNKSQKPYFWDKNDKKIQLCHAQQHIDLQDHAEFQEKLISQSQEKFCKERQKDGQTDPNS